MARPNLIRDIHQVSVLNLIRRHGSTSRARLAQELGLTRSTLTNLVNQLTAEGYIMENGERIVRNGTGRPGVGLMLNADGAYFVGADVGYGRINVVITNLAAEVVARSTADFVMSDPPRRVLEQAAALIAEVRGAVPGGVQRTKGIGVTVPGTTVGGHIVLSPVLSWRNVNLQEPLQAVTGCPVLVDNNANAAAMAELYFRQGEDIQNLVFIHLGAGIGSGIVIDGEIHRGSFGAAGEIGNMRLAPSGPLDIKGNAGTFEALAALGPVMRSYRERGGSSTDLAGLIQELHDGDPAASEVVDEWSRWLGQAILMLVNVLNPEMIVLGGPLAPLSVVSLPALERLVRREQLPGSDRVSLEVSSLGDDTNALGGAMLVYHTMFSLPELSVPRPVQGVPVV